MTTSDTADEPAVNRASTPDLTRAAAQAAANLTETPDGATSQDAAIPASTTPNEQRVTAEAPIPPFLIDVSVATDAERSPRKGFGGWVARWLVPLALFAIVGGAAGYAVTQPRRTDMPGLRTKPDGRYVFAPLRLPAIPEHSPMPGDADNPTGSHLADIRTLLLRPPVGAIAVKSVANDGWMTQQAFANVHSSASTITTELRYEGCRHIAAREWRTPDGATTTIYLLQFDNGTQASDFLSADVTEGYAATPGSVGGNQKINGTTVNIASTSITHGSRSRIGEFAVGDTYAVIIFSAPSSVGSAPFDQIITLQAQMLS
jgi:hypothetical protein